MLALLQALAARMTSPLNERDTAAAIGLSRERFRGRLNRLVNTMAAMRCHQIDERGRPIEGSQSKLYLLDPLIAGLPHLVDPAYGAPAAPAVAEATLGICIARAVESLHDGRLIESRATGYVRTGNRGEIDFGPLPLRVGGTLVESTPIESKWVSSGWRGEALTLENSLGRGIVATKNILDVDGFPTWAVPAGIVALLLA